MDLSLWVESQSRKNCVPYSPSFAHHCRPLDSPPFLTTAHPYHRNLWRIQMFQSKSVPSSSLVDQSSLVALARPMCDGLHCIFIVVQKEGRRNWDKTTAMANGV
ncbi:hypothetical protein K2173_023122 [Erythroxylum novogranatense]|uniref:Uncharacterized protein n=1 Tax=Erythroxylum novogranatense TaxID=1862640 RepID=A0AAV8U7P3_9ROSI|nr:hypothetical protein K2173_023122 [Erythroxylum novogranatense]